MSDALKVGPPSPRTRGRAGVPRGAWFGAALALFSILTWFALNQPPRADPYRELSPTELRWWLERPEWNPERRAAYFPVEVRSILGTDDGSTLWAVGVEGTIYESTDEGGSWAKVEIPFPEITRYDPQQMPMDMEKRR